MDRQILIQIIATLVVLGILIRWIPNDNPRDALGRGDPQKALKIDAHLSQFDPDGVLRRAYMMGVRRPGPERWFQRWKKLLQRTEKIIAERDETTFVQFKGMGRNDQWPLMYDLWPVRTSFYYYEQGSRAEDETIPGATVITGGMLRIEDMNDEQVERFLDMKDRQGKSPDRFGEGDDK